MSHCYYLHCTNPLVGLVILSFGNRSAVWDVFSPPPPCHTPSAFVAPPPPPPSPTWCSWASSLKADHLKPL